MTNTDKILAEFDERMVRLNKAKITRHISDRHIFQWNDKKTPSHGDQYEDSEYGYLDEMLRTLFSDSITQALAEEKERLLGEIYKNRKNILWEKHNRLDINADESKGYNKALDDLKPIISNLLK